MAADGPGSARMRPRALLLALVALAPAGCALLSQIRDAIECRPCEPIVCRKDALARGSHNARLIGGEKAQGQAHASTLHFRRALSRPRESRQEYRAQGSNRKHEELATFH